MTSSSPLWLALHLPALPLEVYTRGSQAGALVVSSGGTRPRVVSASIEAQAAGVCEGLALAAAQALIPSLLAKPRQLRAEAAALEQLGAWAMQFTPTVVLLPPDGLALEIGGCARLFGGMPRLLERVNKGLEALGFSAVTAVAPTARGAELLARCGLEVICLAPVDLPSCLSTVPTALLALTAKARESLADAGIETFGDCLRLPRDGLARRFGQALLDDLDRALGRLPEAVSLFAPPTSYAARLELAAPAENAEALIFAARRLLSELQGWLAGRGQGVLRFELRLGHYRRGSTTCVFKLSVPTREAEALARIVRERWTRETLADRVEWLSLASLETGPWQPQHGSLFGAEPIAPQVAGALLDRLRARLGETAVHTLEPVADFRPERASVAGLAGPLPVLPEAPRPLWLEAQPQPLRESAWEVLDGPERLESGWWDGQDTRRDYYVVRTARGEVWWVYRDLGRDGAWFRHGIFS